MIEISITLVQVFKVNSLFSDTFATDQCKEDVIPFLCLFGFPLYSCPQQEVVLPTKEECQRIIMTTCQAEFHLANLFGLEDLLPDCNELPSGLDESGIVQYSTLVMIVYKACMQLS